MLLKADRRRAAEAAAQMLDGFNVTEPPVNPFSIARQVEIELRAVADPRIDFSGCLIHQGGAWGILYRDDIPVAGFKRFTVAHELGHFEMPHHHDVIHAGGTMHVSESGFTSHLWYEQEADHFASELLMPPSLFTDAICGKTIGLPTIKDLSDQFQTSLTSTAIRYAQLSPDPVAIVVSKEGRIQYCFTSSCMRSIRADFVERAAPVPRESITHRMFSEGAQVGAERQGTSYCTAWFEKATRELEFAEEVIDLGRYGRILTVLHALELPSDDPMDMSAEDDEDDGGLNRDGKRYRW